MLEERGREIALAETRQDGDDQLAGGFRPAPDLERGVASGEFEPCDPWLSASVVWVGANAVIQTLEVPERRSLWERDVPLVYHETVELFLRGLAKR